MSTPASVRVADPYAALSHAPFRWFTASLLAMTMSAQVQAVVIGWQIYQVTGKPFALGLLGLAEVLPFVTVALYAGYVVDRRDRRGVSLAALTILLLAAAALFAMSLAAPQPSRVWPFYLVVGICGVARSFLQTSRSALIAEIVPREHFPNAAIWRSSTWQLGTVLGPALGGVLFAAIGARGTFGINTLLSGASLGAMALLRHRPTPVSAGAGSIRRNLAEGIRFLLRTRVVLGAISLDLLAVLFGGAIAMFPVFASDILHVGPRGFGILQAAPGAGAVVMTLVIAHRPPFRRAGRTLLSAVAVFGVAIITFALSRSFVLSVAMLVLSGAADNISAVIRSTMIQVLVPPAMLGRVSAVNTIFIGSSNELGAFESGLAARLMGVVPSVVFGGTMTLLTAGAVASSLREVRDLGEIGA
jgi:MFS family permease